MFNLLHAALPLFFVQPPPTAGQPAHWSFRKPVRPPVPKARNIAWVQNPIDAFILNRLENKGFAPSPSADRRTLLRRVTFDLTGLPPTPQEIADFTADKSPNAYQKVVKRLLASPRFGERWAQHWLDVVRYGETNGYEHDLERPQAWRYRDYVIEAFNRDTPYNQFITEQVAGDLLAPNDFNKRVATGFLRAGPQHLTGGNQDAALNRQEWLTEATAGIGNTFLGLTIGCARCHDHKYDPIPQADYYRLQAFLSAADNSEYKNITPEEQKAYDEKVKAYKLRLKPIEDQIGVIEKPYRAKLRAQKMERLPQEYKEALAVESAKRTPKQKELAGEVGVQLNVSWDEVLNALNPPDREKRTGLRTQLHKLEMEEPEPLRAAMGVSDVLKPVPDMHILLRGDPHVPGKVVTAGFPSAINTQYPSSTSNRLELAKWLANPDNPLTSRVMVNRLWSYCFGKGIVETPNDFGLNGKRPTNPELLDWLATEFPRRGWRVKSMLEMIVTSNTYRQAGTYDAIKAKADPDNRLLWRMNRKRLDGEAIRDSILLCSGKINLQRGGPWIKVPLEPEVVDTIFTEYEPDNLWPVNPDKRQHARRTIYLHRKRNVRLPMLAAFDQPDMMTSCAARGESVHALQSLILVNSDFMQSQSREMAVRLINEVPTDEMQRISRLFTITVGRPPAAKELSATQRFLKDQLAIKQHHTGSYATAELPLGVRSEQFIAWRDLCLAMFNLNEFIYVQ
jgi:hypothetical protein